MNPGRESGSDREGKIFGKYTGVDISRSMLDAAKTVMQTVKASPLGTVTYTQHILYPVNTLYDPTNISY